MVLLLLSGAAGTLLVYGRTNIDQTSVDGVTSEKGRTVTLKDGGSIEIMTVLLVGVDNPDSLTPEQRAKVAPDERSGRRPDTLLLAQLEVGGDRGALMSFPRDLRVELCDGSVDKINASFVAGRRSGVEPESCLVKTVTALSGIDIDHYVEVDFGGFLRVVEALGGVRMYLDEPMIDRKAHLNVPTGCVTLTPEQALGFVRSRGYDSDYGRMARQQRFLKEMIEEARQLGVLANPARLVSLVDRASDAVRTDDGMGLSEMRDFAMGLRNLTSASLVTRTVPSRTERIDGISYELLEEVEAEALFAGFRDGSILAPVRAAEGSEAGQAAERDRPTPADVSPLVVLNATETPGLAGRTAELLEQRGFRVARVGNATGVTATTEVVYGSGLQAQAQLVADVLPDAVVRRASGGEPLTLILGDDLDLDTVQRLLSQAEARAEPAEPRGSPAATASASASASPSQGGGTTATPAPSPTPTPTAEPTPEFRNAAPPAGTDC